MRICRLNRIKIKNPEKWDKAQFTDFVGDRFIQERKVKKKDSDTDESGSGVLNPTMLTINEEVTIYEYAPKKFQEIREMDNIDKQKIKFSLSAKRNRDQVFKAGESQGKSGSFFFFSHDQEFIIKTMYDDELKVFLQALPQYFAHLNKHPDSLIARIYGVFKVQMEDIVPVNLLLMANTIKHNNTQWIQNVFDLKGSIINRNVKLTPNLKPTSTLKDVNL